MKKELRAKIFKWNYEIIWQDIDPQMVEIAKANAKSAWVDDTIKFECKDICKMDKRNGFIVTNPPYGKRLKNYDLNKIYESLISLFKWNLGCFISSHPNVDKMIWFDFKIKNLNNNGEAVKVYLKK
jgi:putative N6-adenine-specific DNA methylase